MLKSKLNPWRVPPIFCPRGFFADSSTFLIIFGFSVAHWFSKVTTVQRFWLLTNPPELKFDDSSTFLNILLYQVMAWLRGTPLGCVMDPLRTSVLHGIYRSSRFGFVRCMHFSRVSCFLFFCNVKFEAYVSRLRKA